MLKFTTFDRDCRVPGTRGILPYLSPNIFKRNRASKKNCLQLLSHYPPNLKVAQWLLLLINIFTKVQTVLFLTHPFGRIDRLTDPGFRFHCKTL